MNKQGAYIFKCSDFLRFIEDKSPLLGQRSIYFINAKIIDKETGEIKNFSADNVTSLVGKGKSIATDLSNDKVIFNSVSKASRRYLPLLKINEQIFNEFFRQNIFTTEETKYITESIRILSKNLKKKGFPEEKRYYSLFEEWFLKAYFYSLEIPFNKIGNIKYEGLKYALHSYYNNIYELVQNIIFHGGRKGLMYFVFNKKENISEIQKKKIPNFEEYNDPNQRFVEIGIYDFNAKGIVESYVEKYSPNDNFELKDFFDHKNILTTGLKDHLDLRYTAHLGLKSFVKSVLNHNGYFSVESNYKGKKQRVESVIFLDLKGNSECELIDDIIYVNGTHYTIILPVKSLENSHTIPSQPQTQKKSIVEKLRNRIITKKWSIKHIRLVDFLVNHEFKTYKPLSKEEQKQRIIYIGNEILKEFNKDGKVKNEIAIDLSDFEIDSKDIFKLLSYIQLSHQITFEKIILTHISDDQINEICNTIEQFLITPKIEPIWSITSAVILVSNELHYQIICGKTTEEFYNLNNEFQKYYYPSKNYFEKIESKNSDLNKLAEIFILPYEVLIEKNKCSYFEQYVIDILKVNIESDNMGYCVSNLNTYIGSKLIIKNYYEADSMFQNSFFAERFAFLVSRDILQSKCLTEKVKIGEKVVIIGYKSYSELLVKTIKKLKFK